MMNWRDLDQVVLRMEAARIALPLVILGFFSTRLVHADHWLGQSGFNVPDLGGHWAQPLYLAPVSDPWAWTIAAALVVAGVATAAGFKTRWSALVFAALLFYVGFADRLAAFTVTKLAPVLALTLAVAPVGRRMSVDRLLGWAEDPNPDQLEGPLRFLQVLPVVVYTASGLCKIDGDWLDHSAVIWTHVHSSYQSWFAWLAAAYAPAWFWSVAQWSVLIFEVGAALWLYKLATRSYALGFAIVMHLAIGLMFSPVIWFSLLMIALVCVGFLPAAVFEAQWLKGSTARNR